MVQYNRFNSSPWLGVELNRQIGRRISARILLAGPPDVLD